MQNLTRLMLALFLGLCSLMIYAGCSRPIIVPAAPTGFSIRIEDQHVSGIYPELLRELGKKYGCQFVFMIVPRARAEMMVFQSGEGDLLLPISRTNERDQKADFYYLTTIQPSLIYLKTQTMNATSMKEILANQNLTGAFVRAYSYGEEYNQFINELKVRNRVSLVNDMEIVGKLLNAKRVQFTVVAATIFASELSDNLELVALRDNLRFVALSDIGSLQNGVYLSKHLSDADRSILLNMLAEVHSRNLLRPLLEKYYSKELIQATFIRN